MKRLSILVSCLLALMMSPLALANSGLFFNVISSGKPANFSLNICLNGNLKVTCQDYLVTGLNFTVKTLVTGHLYPNAGIKVNTPSYSIKNCTIGSNGYCLFAASSSAPASFVAVNATPLTVGGAITGLTGTLTIRNNNTDTKILNANGSFTFNTPIETTNPYSVTILTQPAGQQCTVGNGVGIMGTTSVTDVTISCAPNQFTVGGTVTGLSGSVVLQNNNSNPTLINTDGNFTFSAPVMSGNPYSVTVLTQPANQMCTVGTGSGVITNANVTTVSVVCNNITYTVTSSSDANGTVSPAGGTTVVQGASQSFTATPSTGYAVSQWLLDGNVVQTGGTAYTLNNVRANHTVQVTFAMTTLSSSISTLALSVKCPTAGGSCVYSNASLTGTSRVITITNSGSFPAINVAITSSGLPAGTTVASTTCGTTLAANASCTITMTPGQVATAGAGGAACTTGIAPVNGTVTVASANTPPTTINIVVLGYGCLVQSGYMYSVNDATANNTSISGRIIQATDSGSGIVWDSGTGCTTSPFTGCFTTTATSPSNGTFVGPSGNTFLIYRTLTVTNNELVTSYAAGLCVGAIDGYSDWYLPAICELGYGTGTTTAGINCGTQAAPSIQNVESNLVDISGADVAGLTTGPTAGNYWSSTENSSTPGSRAWAQQFRLAMLGSQVPTAFKGVNTSAPGVRCVRTLTASNF